MAEVRQIPADEYEAQKKSYGFTDDQMKSILGLEPIKVRWADGFGDSRKKEDNSTKARHQQLVEEIKNKLKKEQISTDTSSKQSDTKETTSNKEENSTISQSFETPININEDSNENSFNTPDFNIPTFENVTQTEQTFQPENSNIPEFKIPSFEMPTENEIKTESKFDENTFEIPNFEIPEFNTSSIETTFQPEPINDTPIFNTNNEDSIPKITSSEPQKFSRDEMFEIGKNKLLELIKNDNKTFEIEEITR